MSFFFPPWSKENIKIKPYLPTSPPYPSWGQSRYRFVQGNSAHHDCFHGIFIEGTVWEKGKEFLRKGVEAETWQMSKSTCWDQDRGKRVCDITRMRDHSVGENLPELGGIAEIQVEKAGLDAMMWQHGFEIFFLHGRRSYKEVWGRTAPSHFILENHCSHAEDANEQF